MPDRHQNTAAAGVAAVPHAAITALLIERGRAGLWIMLVALAVLWAADVGFDPALVEELTAITLFQAACIGAGFVALRRAHHRSAAACVPVLVLAGIFASGVVSDVVTRNPQGTSLSALVTCLISATLMPWGPWFQLATVGVTALAGAASIWLCTGSLVTLGYAAAPATVLLLGSVAVAYAFERARHDRLRLETELRLLQTVSLEVGAAPDPESALAVVLRRMCEASGWVLGQAWAPRADGTALECVAWWSTDAIGVRFHEASRSFVFAPGDGLPGRVWRSRQPAWVRDVRADPDFPRADLARRFGLSAGMAIPVLADDEAIVVLEFFVRESHDEDARAMDVFAGVAVQLGSVIQRKRAERLADEAAETAAALVDVGRTLSTHLGKPDMLERVTALAVGALGCDWSATFLVDDAGRTLTLGASAGLAVDVAASLADAPLAVDCLRLDGDGDGAGAVTVVEIPDVARDPDAPAVLRRLGAAAVLYAPVRLAGTLMGMQVHGYRVRTGPFATKQRRLATGVADATAIAIANARLIDDLQASSRLKSEFVATMSHELRTPLNIILGYSDMLAEGVVGPLADEQRDTLARVQRAGIELLDLVNATLDMGRLEAGRDSVVPTTVDVHAVLRQLDVELGPLVAPGVVLRWDNRIDGDALVTDKVKLKTILKNLVGNALKFTTAGTVDVRAEWQADRVRLTVRDTGVGIPKDSLPVIFEMFRQADGSSTRTFGGVGLGLHIVRRLVDLLGGDVAVASELGVGSTFTVSWPAQPAPLRSTGT